MKDDAGVSATSWLARWQSALPWLLAVAYLLITIGYGRINPLFEAPDEHHHFFTVLYVAENGRLPIASPNEEWLRQEAAQPPLYYLLAALLAWDGQATPAQADLWPNPHAILGDASALTNINRFIPLPAPGYAAPAYRLRLLSALIGLGTLLCIYAAARLLWPRQPEIALLSAGLVAFLPQFNFLHSAISNDVLVIFLTSAALWQLIRLWQTHTTPARLLLLGLTIGLTILTKNAGTLLLVYALGFLMVNGQWSTDNGQPPTFKRLLTIHNWRFTIGNLLLVLLPALLVGGWLWWRNWLLYGDITATAPFIQFAGGDREASPLQVLGEWQSIWPSLFAVFGWFNLRPPQWVYWVWYGLVVAAVGGVVKSSIANRRSSLVTRQFVLVLLLAGWVLLVYAGLFLFMLQTEAAQGRLLFPAILPLALGLAYGLSRWRWRGAAPLALLLALATTLYSLFFVVRPAYAPPPVIAALPSTAVSLAMDMGQGVRLVGAELETATAVPGDIIWLTLYWQATEPPEKPVEFVLELLGRNFAPVAGLQSYHGRGLYPANLWSPGAIIADRFALRLDETAGIPVLAALYAGLAGEQARALVGEIVIQPEAWPMAGPALATIGEGIALTAVSLTPTAAQPGQPITLTVQWQATHAPGENYTALVHLGEAGQPPVATGDNQPVNGRYPTRLWPAGAVVDDVYTISLPLDLPDGRYPIWLGLYNSATLARLPLVVQGQRQTNDVYLAGWIEVMRP
ncbi:MAG: glycosyltransferase family 39 protein [Chloroflexi bacterium]|nr:glycosyltransferase family 39 protein [Chloroflexota bacterium]